MVLPQQGLSLFTSKSVWMVLGLRKTGYVVTHMQTGAAAAEARNQRDQPASRCTIPAAGAPSNLLREWKMMRRMLRLSPMPTASEATSTCHVNATA